MSIIFGLAAYDQYIRAFKFVGNREVKKIKWEKGFDQNRASEFAAGKLPATRFLSFWACVVMCFDFTTRAAQQWDLRNNYVSREAKMCCFTVYILQNSNGAFQIATNA